MPMLGKTWSLTKHICLWGEQPGILLAVMSDYVDMNGEGIGQESDVIRAIGAVHENNLPIVVYLENNSSKLRFLQMVLIRVR